MALVDDLWTARYHELELAQFSLIAANLLIQEIDEKEMSLEDLKDFRARHKRHIQAANRHRRKSERIGRKLARIQKKENR